MSGKFTDPQRDLYNAVLNVHRTSLALCRENANLSLDKLHGIAENGLKDQLKQLGFDMSGAVCSIPINHDEAATADTITGYQHSLPPSLGPLYWPRCT